MKKGRLLSTDACLEPPLIGGVPLGTTDPGGATTCETGTVAAHSWPKSSHQTADVRLQQRDFDNSGM
jgi:hypothetical protein